MVPNQLQAHQRESLFMVLGVEEWRFYVERGYGSFFLYTLVSFLSKPVLCYNCFPPPLWGGGGGRGVFSPASPVRLVASSTSILPSPCPRNPLSTTTSSIHAFLPVGLMYVPTVTIPATESPTRRTNRWLLASATISFSSFIPMGAAVGDSCTRSLLMSFVPTCRQSVISLNARHPPSVVLGRDAGQVFSLVPVPSPCAFIVTWCRVSLLFVMAAETRWGHARV